MKLQYVMQLQEHYFPSLILCNFRRDLLTCQHAVRKANSLSYYVQGERIEMIGFFPFSTAALIHLGWGKEVVHHMLLLGDQHDIFSLPLLLNPAFTQIGWMSVQQAEPSSRTVADSYWPVVNTTAPAVFCSRPQDLHSRKVSLPRASHNQTQGPDRILITPRRDWRPTLGLVLSAGALTEPPDSGNLEEEENRTNRLPATRSLQSGN